MKAYCELHTHIGASVQPHVLWEIAKAQGMKLQGISDYREFERTVTADPHNMGGLDKYLDVLHKWTEKIQSSPKAIYKSVYGIVSHEFRTSNVVQTEVRFNPMKRNCNGETDLDYIIDATLHGMKMASLDYGVKAGLILCMAREYDTYRNRIILDKAIRHADDGIVGIDMAGLERYAIEDSVDAPEYAAMFDKAKAHGLGVTYHTGETSGAPTGTNRVMATVNNLKPDRIGHGVQAAWCERTMDLLRETDTVLELCPSSNIRTGAIASMDQFGWVLGRFEEYGVLYTINTDGVSLCKTNLEHEFQLVAPYLTDLQLEAARLRAFKSSFIED